MLAGEHGCTMNAAARLWQRLRARSSSQSQKCIFTQKTFAHIITACTSHSLVHAHAKFDDVSHGAAAGQVLACVFLI